MGLQSPVTRVRRLRIRGSDAAIDDFSHLLVFCLHNPGSHQRHYVIGLSAMRLRRLRVFNVELTSHSKLDRSFLIASFSDNQTTERYVNKCRLNCVIPRTRVPCPSFAYAFVYKPNEPYLPLPSRTEAGTQLPTPEGWKAELA